MSNHFPGKTCADCGHCQPGMNTSKDVMVRTCQRNPPRVIPVITQQGVAVISARPEIRASDAACGEFASEVNK